MSRWLHPFYIVDGHNIVDEPHLQFRIFLGVGGHGGSSVDFQQPCFAVGVEDEIESIELEGIGAIGD